MECDFRVFYRFDDMYSVPAPRFFAYAQQCIAYHGAIRREWELEVAEDQVAQELALEGDQFDRLSEAGAEVQAVPITDSYFYDLLEAQR